MRVKILTSMAGPEITWQPGDIVDVSNDVAKRLIAAGFAEEIDVEIPETQREKRIYKRSR